MKKTIKTLTAACAGLVLAIGVTASPASALPTPTALYFGGLAGSIADCSNIANVGIYTDHDHTTAATSLSGTSGFVNVANDCQYYAVYYSLGSSTGSIPGTAFNSGNNSSTTASLTSSGTFTLYRCALVGGGSGNGSASGCVNAGDRTQAATLTSTITTGGSGGGGGGGVTPPSPTPSASASAAPSEAAKGTAAALAELPKSSTSPKLTFDSSANGLGSSAKKSLKKVASIAKDGYGVTITGSAGMQQGVSLSAVRELARKRALEIRDYLVKQGVNKDDITIKTKIFPIGKMPTTKVNVETLS